MIDHRIIDDHCRWWLLSELWPVVNNHVVLWAETWTLIRDANFIALLTCNITWTSEIWEIAGFPNIINSTNRIVFGEISPQALETPTLLAEKFLVFHDLESRAKERIISYPNSPNIFGPKNSRIHFTWKKFALKFRVNSLLARGMCPVCPCVRVSWSAALNPFQNHGSGVFFGGGASGWGPWEILNFDSCESVKFRLKKNKLSRFGESEMVGTCWNGFLFCSVFFFLFRRVSESPCFNLETREVRIIFEFWRGGLWAKNPMVFS